MSIIVTKFGGTSLATPALIMSVAKKIFRISKNNDVVVVVSAMGDTTDKLLAMSRQITAEPKARELDMLLTAGERISVALLSMALEKLNLKAVSYTGSQVGIITDNKHTDARILEIRGERLKKALSEHKITVVCGFQGVSLEKEITTLGRGGSDTTALALSAALKAERCIIYTDVDGVYTEDPNKYPGVKKINKISYNEMLELSCRGAQVLHPRASSIAARFKIPVEIRNSFNNKSGTLITDLKRIENPRPKAITHNDELYLITLMRVIKRPNYLSQIVTELAKAGIHLKFFFHGISSAKKFDLSFIIPLEEKEKAKSILRKVAEKLKIRQISESSDICSLSLIGQGIGSANRILTEVFNTLSKTKIHIEAITTSELSVNIFLRKKYLDRGVNALLEKFNLKKKT
ncbi:MAG TPA: aspartate kinase [candidate division WOR-3 bacterium]|uniref:Aspartokinase n=1 Tax=candidate division WOR-3 bacterium TaxID=2052148 RepID=A0A9C9JZG8_UNCW3|nr:aspartate kinase [candidate division WOR-3 bacterium]